MPPPPFGSQYDQLHQASLPYGEDYGQYPSPARGKTARFLLMAGIFVIGTAVGLAAAWWFNRPASGTAMSAIEPVRRLSVPPAVAKNRQIERSTAVRGISPGELPYDGAAPPPVVVERGRAAASVVTRSTGSDFSSGTSLAEPRTENASPRQPSRPEPANVQKADAADAKPAKARRQVRDEDDDLAARSKRRAQIKPSKDREIERIRQQADDELKKKTESGRRVEAARARTRRAAVRQNNPQVAAAMRAMLARCERASNFIRREQCKWQLCRGIWGKNGCPSYPHHSNAY